MNISDSIRYIGVDDHKIDLFEGQFDVPNGMAYNSYVIIDEKIAVLDTVDGNFTDEWLAKLDKELDGRQPDYLIMTSPPDSFSAFSSEPISLASMPSFIERRSTTISILCF